MATARAAEGVSGPGASLPHHATIAAAFGHHDVGAIEAHVGGAAADAARDIGAEAYATGAHVAFVGAPDLHTAAHEAAHVVQQRGGVQLKDGVGRAGDPYEEHADAVADRVVEGESAEALLDQLAGSGAPSRAVQRQAPRGNGPETPDERAAALREEMGISVKTVPEAGGSRTAYVGGQVQFGLEFARPPTTRTVRARSWGMDTPRGRWSQTPTGPTTILPIKQAGAHRFWVDLDIDGVRLEVQHDFVAVAPSTRTDALIAGQEGLTLGQLRSQLVLQEAMLNPPGPGDQAADAYLRIHASAANPAREESSGASLLSYSIEDRGTDERTGAAIEYHWYLKPFRWEGMPEKLGSFPRTKVDAIGDVFDMGTGPVAMFPATHHGAFLVICRTAEAGKSPRDARYLQSVLTADGAKAADRIVEHGKRVDDLGGRVHGDAVPVVASHVAVETAAETMLRLYLGRARSDPGKWLLLDLTPGLDPEHHELEYQGQNAAAAIKNFEEDNRYPKGAISLRVDANAQGVLPISRRFETDGQTLLGTLSSGAGIASLLLGLGAIAAAPFTGGGSLLVTVLMIGSATAAATAGALSLADHLKTDKVSEAAIALDVLTIATSFLNAGMGIRALRGGPAVLVASRGARYLLWTSFTLEGVSAILVGLDGAEQIAKIVESGASPEEKSRLVVAVVANMILTGTLLAVSYGDLKTTRSRLRNHLGETIDSVGDADSLSLALLDDDSLKGLRGASNKELTCLADVVRDDPSALARIGGRADLLAALKLARGNKAIDLELAHVHLHLQRRVLDEDRIDRLLKAMRAARIRPGRVAEFPGDSLEHLASPTILSRLESGASLLEEALVRELLQDTNKKFPLTEVNARKMLHDYAPAGFEPRAAAGKGGAGGDLVFEGPKNQTFRIENKSTQSFRAFDSELAHAALDQVPGSLVFVQVPEGTDVKNWLARFWGNRKTLLSQPTAENRAKLEIYKKTDVVIVDNLGNTLLERQAIYNPKQARPDE